ncbi:MAG: hypothetical protein RR398_06960 [Clostridia bacterium]
MKTSATVYPSSLLGTLEVIKSKSEAVRAIICAAFGGGTVENLDAVLSDDVIAARNAARAILSDKTLIIHAGESASVLRFLIPLAIMLKKTSIIVSDSLIPRTVLPYSECLKYAKIEKQGDRYELSGEIRPGLFKLRGDISSQFISGLMFALPLLNGDSVIELTTSLESRSYVQMTMDSLLKADIYIKETDSGFFIRGNQKYMPYRYTLSGDYTYAANFIVANALGAHINFIGLREASIQGDSAIYRLINETEIDISNTPDLFPILAVLACFRNTVTRIYNVKRLTLKECDRFSCMTSELKKLGANLALSSDDVKIFGEGGLNGGTVDSHGDHRLVMALAIAAANARAPVVINNHLCVKKSAPRFFEEFQAMGGKVIEYMGN